MVLLLQRIKSETGMGGVTGASTDDPPGIGVDDEHHIADVNHEQQ